MKTNQHHKFNKRVLVVDDDEVLRYSLIKALERFGMQLFEAESLLSMQKVVQLQAEIQKPIEWTILDLRLGNESGLELAQWILQHNSDIQIVIITGYASISTAVEAIKLGVKNYLIKPVSVEEIIQAFESKQVDVKQPIENNPLSPKRLEWEHIQKVLLSCDGNVSQAARALNMHRRTLQRKLQKKPVKD